MVPNAFYIFGHTVMPGVSKNQWATQHTKIKMSAVLTTDISKHGRMAESTKLAPTICSGQIVSHSREKESWKGEEEKH